MMEARLPSEVTQYPRDYLRQVTCKQHARLGQILPLGREVLTEQQYIGLLQRFCSLYGGLEMQLQTHAARFDIWGLRWEQRRKHHLLRQDLRALGQRPSASVSISPWANTAQALGCLYVLEGSTLGGQIIARQLRQQLGFTDVSGLAFFGSYGRDVGPMWKAFCGTLNKALRDPQRLQDAATAACTTFLFFLNHFGEKTQL